MAATTVFDPFSRCEMACSHDLAAGVLVEELLGSDGPHDSTWAGDGIRSALVFILGDRGDQTTTEPLAA